MEQVQFHIKGISTLLMHSPRTLNPTDPGVRAMKEITGKRKKTDQDLEALARIEWELALYYDKDRGPIIPGSCLDAAMIAGAKLDKMGQQAQSGAFVLDDSPLEYEGPRDLKAMYEDGRFVDTRPVKVQRARVMRTRARFDDWAAKFAVVFDPEVLNRADVIRFIEQAGKLKGLMDYRPRYGRFETEVLNGAAS